MPTNPSLSMPTQQQPAVDDKGRLTQPYWRFLFGLFKRTSADTPAVVATGLTATGTTQATALPLTAEWNQIGTVPVNGGVLLNAFGAGVASAIWNDGINDLNVYPPSGAAVDGLAADAPYVLAAGASQQFFQLTGTSFRTVQP